MVVSPYNPIIMYSAYFDPTLSTQVVQFMGEHFSNTTLDTIWLIDWVSIFTYFRTMETTKVLMEVEALGIILQLDYLFTNMK